MSVTLVAHTFQRGSATSPAIDTTGANLIVVALGSYTGNPIVQYDSKSNSWTNLTLRNGNSSVTRIAYMIGGVVGSGHTFTISGGLYSSFCVAAFACDSLPTYQSENGANSTASSIATGSASLVGGGGLVIAGVCFQKIATVSIDSGFTISDEANQVDGSSVGSALAYKVVGSAGSESPTWTIGSSGDLGAAIATFQFGSSGPANPTLFVGGIGMPGQMPPLYVA